MRGSVRRTATGLLALAAAGALAPGVAHAAQTSAVWSATGTPSATHDGHAAEIHAASFSAFKLDIGAMDAKLATAPRVGLRARAMASGTGTVIAVPAPDGTLQRFEVQDSPVMEPGLAAEHPEIQTYAGRGLDDPAATIRADSTPLGFHASVRGSKGDWYVDPYYHLDQSTYVSYYGHDLQDEHGNFEEGDVGHLDDPLNIGSLAKQAADSTVQLRTYRLALVTDPSYSTYFHGDQDPNNVTAAKVTLMNRVDQIYEDETAIRMVLINNLDKINLNTDAQAIGANGPCGAAACFTAAQLSTCDSPTLTRNRIVLGQIIGASNYDIGHIGLGKDGGGIASLGVVGGNNKAQGCTGLPTPVGDFYAVDYVAHEMGHEYAGNHTFNGTQRNCSSSNRNPGTSVEPGSGTSIMAYAGICDQDNTQPHSDPYWSQRSFDEITTYTSSDRANINEVQTASLRDFDGTDSFTLGYNGNTTAPIVRGTNYTAAGIALALQGVTEVQTVGLTGYDDGDTYTLSYGGVDSVPITRGQNNTAAGIAAALQGGNEAQQVTLTGFTAASQSFAVQVNGQTTATFGLGGLAVSNANLTSQLAAILGTGNATASGAGNGGFTVTFTGALAQTDVPSIAIVNCTGACTSAVRENVKGSKALSSWPAGGTVTASTPTDTGYTLTFGGNHQGTDVSPVSLTNVNGFTGAVTETTKGTAGILPAGSTVAVTGWGNSTFNDTGFQMTFGGALAGTKVSLLAINVADGASGFMGETAQGGPIQNKGFIITDTGNHAPVVTTAPAFTIPTRTPFSLTGSATDADSDPLTYMWEQNDIGGPGNNGGTALVNNTKVNGPLFRQFGVAAQVSATDTLLTPSPGENHVDNNPTRVFPDMAQIVSGNTNAATGACPPAPPVPPTGAVPPVDPKIVDCFSEFLPTAAWVGVLSDKTLNFRLTARDYRPGGGGVGNAATKLTIAPLAGPFRVTAPSVAQTMYAQSPQTVTWDVAGTDLPPVSVSQVKISLSTDGGMTYPYVLADAVPNNGSARVVLPNVTASAARFKVESVGNVFFDISHTDVKIVAAPTGGVSGSVPATLSLSLGTPAPFAPFKAGQAGDYDTSGTATVVSTAGDAALSVADPSAFQPGHLVNGTFFLPSALQADANGGTRQTVSGTPATLLNYTAPVSNGAVTLGFHQHIGNTDALRTGTYAKTLTFTLSTTTP